MKRQASNKSCKKKNSKKDGRETRLIIKTKGEQRDNKFKNKRFSVELGNITNLDLFLEGIDDFINNNPDNDMKNKLVYFVLNSIENYFYLF